jgi:hypothetical protein
MAKPSPGPWRVLRRANRVAIKRIMIVDADARLVVEFGPREDRFRMMRGRNAVDAQDQANAVRQTDELRNRGPDPLLGSEWIGRAREVLRRVGY